MKLYIHLISILILYDKVSCDDVPLRLPEIWPCKYVENANVTKRIYVECEGQNLATLSILLQKFSDETVHRLDLVKEEFSILYGKLFHTIILEELYINDTPIEHIEANALRSLQEDLKVFSLINSKLDTFPTEALQPSSNLKTLKIDGSSIEKLDKASFTNSSWTAGVDTFYVTNAAINDLEAGCFMSFKKLKRLYLSNNKLTVLKKNQFQGLREVESLDLSHNELVKVDTSHIGDLSKLVYFNASHNKLTEISRGAFARNSVLRWLDLSNNKIKRLDQHSFRGMRFLSRLFLSDNAITDVSRGTFESVKRIGTINLARNLISKIDYGMFFELNYVEVIDMAENQIVSISKQAFKDLYLTSINISHNSISIMESGAFENCVNMTLLDLSHNNISDFQKEVFDMTSYPGVFNLSYNSLTNFSKIPLAHMNGIRFLNVSFNNITTIPKQTMLKLYELNTIDVSHNSISDIADNIFQPAIGLRFLNLSYNALEKLKVSTFGAITTLLELDLSHNQLKVVPKETFIKLASLSYLTLEDNLLEKLIQPSLSLSTINFKNNQLSSIDAEVWPAMNALLTLDLTNNTLNDNLVDENFASLLTLRELHLSHNNITKISKGSFRGLNSLQYLGLSNNQITEVEKDAFGKMSIFVLNLHENNITKISDLAFMQLTVLATLNLSSNSIQTVPSDAFKGLLSLRIIDLSNNRIERTENKTHSIFEPCLNLEEIHLQKNRISFLSKSSLPYNQWFAYKIWYFDLSQNIMPILTNDITVGTQNVQHLNLSHNFLQEIRIGVLSKMPSLKLLDLSNNNLREFNQTFAANFSQLLLPNNKLHSISWQYLTNLTQLTEVDLRNNNITKLNDTLIPKLQAGLRMSVRGNHLDCDCHLRPFLAITQANKSLNFDLSETTCNPESFTEDQVIGDVREEMLVCPDVEESSYSFSFLSGLQFRVVRFTKGLLWLSWYIKGKADIADFYLNVKDIDNRNTIKEFHIPYDQRTFNISLNSIKSNNMEVCLLSKDSKGKINKYDKHQCFDLHSEWKILNKKCYRNSGRNCDIFDAKSNTFTELKSNEATKSVGATFLILITFINIFYTFI